MINLIKNDAGVTSSTLPTEDEIERIISKEFGEECKVYIDRIDNENANVEVHFPDCNYYEQSEGTHENCEDFINKLIRFIKKERSLDKLYPAVNRNNIRYFNQR